MAAQPPSTLAELVEQLGRTYSPFERLKILGRAWALLRKMTPQERMTVGGQLGLDHADEIVEAITARSGVQASPALLAMIERAQTKGSAHLPQLVADLRDPGRRAARLRQGAKAVLDSAEGALAGEKPEVPWLPPGAASPAAEPPRQPGSSSASQRPAAPQSPRPPAAAPAPQPAPAATRPIAPPAPATAAPAAPPPAAAPTPAPPPAQTAPPPQPKPKEAPPPRPAEAAPPAPPREPAQTSGDGALAGRLAAAPALTARFRLLRRHLGEAKATSAAGLRSLLEGFPDGWARRRVLLELLRGGVPASFRDALGLVEALGTDRDRLWCLAALAERRGIPETDREALLAAAGSSPAARRRLARRLGDV